MSIDDYVKTVGYACIYKSLASKTDKIPLEDITITLVRDGYPRELIKKLESLGNRVILRFALIGNNLTSQGERNNVDAIYQISVNTNRDRYEELKRSDKYMCEALLELMKPEMEERINQAVEQTIINLVNDGMLSVEEGAKRTGMTLEEFEEAMEKQ